MKDLTFGLKFTIIAAAQVLILELFNFSQYMMLAILPVIIIYLPSAFSTGKAVIISFVTGLAIDFLSGSPIGLTSVALLPVAFMRPVIYDLVFGSELTARGESISIRRQGTGKITLAILLGTVIYLGIYIWADGAGTRPVWFNLTKFGLSLLVSTVVSFFVALAIDPES